MPPTDGSDIASQAARLISYVGQHPAPASLLPPMDAFLHDLAPYASSPLLRFILHYAPHIKYDAEAVPAVLHLALHMLPLRSALTLTCLMDATHCTTPHHRPISWLLAQAFRLSGSAELAALVRTTAVVTRVQVRR